SNYLWNNKKAWCKVLKFQGMHLTTGASTDFDRSTNLQFQVNQGSLAVAYPTHRKWGITAGTRKCCDRSLNIIDVSKFLIVAAIYLTQIDMPQFVEDLGFKLD
ncbi:MAG: hypothetical protein KKG10_16495, partial [Proteobacteria bacterium]|nr:hypothetical protein [Pseudomonadota bacterium]